MLHQPWARSKEGCKICGRLFCGAQLPAKLGSNYCGAQPENEVKAAYEPSHEFEVYRDLKKLIDSATGEIFLIDNYLDSTA